MLKLITIIFIFIGSVCISQEESELTVTQRLDSLVTIGVVDSSYLQLSNHDLILNEFSKLMGYEYDDPVRSALQTMTKSKAKDLIKTGYVFQLYHSPKNYFSANYICLNCQDKIDGKFGFQYLHTQTGSSYPKEIIEGIEIYNKEVQNHLAKTNGKRWERRFNRRMKRCIKKKMKKAKENRTIDNVLSVG